MGPVWEKHRRTQPECRGRNWPVRVLIRGAKGHHRWRRVELGTPWPSAPFCYLLLKTWAWLHWIQEISSEHLLWCNWASFRIRREVETSQAHEMICVWWVDWMVWLAWWGLRVTPLGGSSVWLLTDLSRSQATVPHLEFFPPLLYSSLFSNPMKYGFPDKAEGGKLVYCGVRAVFG